MEVKITEIFLIGLGLGCFCIGFGICTILFANKLLEELSLLLQHYPQYINLQRYTEVVRYFRVVSILGWVLVFLGIISIIYGYLKRKGEGGEK